MINKKLSDRINKELDAIGIGELELDRIEHFAKLFKIPKFKAEAILNGSCTPNESLLQKIATELEVDPLWLIGQID